MSLNAAFLNLILEIAKGRVSVTRLVKLAYMADLFSWQVLGRPISELQYRRYHFGPYDTTFPSAVEELCALGLVEAKETTTQEGDDCTLLHAKGGQAPQPEQFFTRAQIHLVSVAVERYLSLPLQRFLSEVVYKTDPMQGAAFNGLLPMEVVKEKAAEAVGGLSLEAILESREQFAKGNYVSAEEAKRIILGAQA